MDGVQLLGLRGPESTSEPHVQAAVEELGKSELEDGYSPRAVEGRMLVLQEAAEGVRHTRNHPGMEPRQLEVEWALLPGTLALLQEVRFHVPHQGDMQTWACPPAAVSSLGGTHGIFSSQEHQEPPWHGALAAAGDGLCCLARWLFSQRCALQLMVLRQHASPDLPPCSWVSAG